MAPRLPLHPVAPRWDPTHTPPGLHPAFLQELHEKYDLKGSWVDRSSRVPRQRPHATHAAATPAAPHTRKDNDLKRRLKLPEKEKDELRGQLARDAELLHALNVMDYSLLLGVHNPKLCPPKEGDSPGADASLMPRQAPLVHCDEAEGGCVYYMTIIDLLQTWTLAKRLERYLKVGLWCRCGQAAAGMSVVEPAAYARRFVRMVDRILARDEAR